MSNEAVLVKFPDGSICFTGYHGCSSAAHDILFASKQQLFEAPFADPEQEAFEKKASSYEEMQAFFKERESRVYDDIEPVELFTPYGGGSLWSGTASKGAGILLSGFSDIDCDTAVDFEGVNSWPSWVVETGLPTTRSLVKENWV